MNFTLIFYIEPILLRSVYSYWNDVQAGPRTALFYAKVTPKSIQTPPKDIRREKQKVPGWPRVWGPPWEPSGLSPDVSRKNLHRFRSDPSIK
jgi:hypothetical protein